MAKTVHKDKPITQTDLENLCRILLAADPDIRDIILFGSFAYVPSLALDIDLLVTTINRKEYGVYLDAVADFPMNVDVVVRQSGDKIGDPVAWSVRAVGQVLLGDGQTLKEVMKVPAPSFQRARKIFHLADENLLNAQKAQDSDIKDELYKDAFNKLFDVARIAVMAYLGSEETRWGRLRRTLPQPFEDRFRGIADTLHISYFYHGDYPKENTDDEFKRWRGQVDKFVDDLEREK